MVTEFLWLIFDVALGVLLAGLVMPLTLALIPDSLRGTRAVIVVAVLSVAVVSVLRRLTGAGSSRPKGEQQGS